MGNPNSDKFLLLGQWKDVCDKVRRGAKKKGIDLSKIEIVRKEGG